MGKLFAIFAILLTFFAVPVQAGETLDYKPGLIQEELDKVRYCLLIMPPLGALLVKVRNGRLKDFELKIHNTMMF